MKRFLKNVGILIGILAAEISLFFLGLELLNSNDNVGFQLNTYEDILKTITFQGYYTHNNIEKWFIGIFILFLFLYINMFLSQILETPKYRSIKLYRYGKRRYLIHCKLYEITGNLCGITIIMIGLFVIERILTFRGNAINVAGTEWNAIFLELIKLFLLFELYGTINIYYLLKVSSSYVFTFSLVFIFVQLLVEIFCGQLHFITYTDPAENVLYMIGLFLINIIVLLTILRTTNRIDMC